MLERSGQMAFHICITYLPRHYNEKIHDVPNIPEIGVFMQNKP